jgi:hypothetical protein
MLVTKKYLFLLILFGSLSGLSAYTQTPIDIAASSVKVGIIGEELVYFGFAEGDKIIFSFEEANGKEMKEVEIIEMPNASRFIEVKTSKIDNKSINVLRTAIYKFRFANSAILPRVCKYKIQRIPAGPATQNFNSTVYFDMYNDTSYTNEVENFIDKTDTVISNFQDRVVKVNPLTAPGTSKSTFSFLIPENTVYWSYYVTTLKDGVQVYQEAAKNLAANSPGVIAKFPNYSPLAAVALERDSYIKRLDTGRHINYWIVENENVDMFSRGEQFRFIKKGKAINDFSRMEPGERNYYFCLHNDFKEGPISVTVKITAVQINEKLVSREVRKMHVTQKNGMHLKN